MAVEERASLRRKKSEKVEAVNKRMLGKKEGLLQGAHQIWTLP